MDPPAAAPRLSADSSAYELTELEELADSFHAVNIPVPHPKPLRHHHSFTAGATNNSNGQHSASLHADQGADEQAVQRKRSHTTDAALHFHSTED